MTINLLDLMTDDDKNIIKRWTNERLHPKYPQDIPIPYYIMAELSHYFGWQAVVDLKRGYHTGLTQNGEPERIRFTLDEANAMIKAAQKVRYNFSK